MIQFKWSRLYFFANGTAYFLEFLFNNKYNTVFFIYNAFVRSLTSMCHGNVGVQMSFASIIFKTSACKQYEYVKSVY